MTVLPISAPFTGYSSQTQCLMAGLLFLAVFAELGYVLFLFSFSAGRRQRALECLIFGASLVFLSYLTAVSAGASLPFDLPWVLPLLIAAVLALRALWKTVQLYRSAREALSGSAAQQALAEEGYVRAQQELQAETEALARTNEELQALYEQLADRIREQESLALKIRVHDEIGTALIAISNLMREGESDAGSQIEALRDAVSYFGPPSKDFASQPGTLREAQSRALGLGVTLAVDILPPAVGSADEPSAAGERAGEPSDLPAQYEKLFAAAALECCANCVKHAGGRNVAVRITREEGTWRAVFTNDGKAPEKPVVEGGGLSSLRKRVETAGGSMRIESSPAFSLTLTLSDG